MLQPNIHRRFAPVWSISSRGADFADLDYGVILRKGLSSVDEAALRGLTLATARGLLIGDPFDHDGDIHKIGVYSYSAPTHPIEGSALMKIERLHLG
jgi:hypothetical protein